MTLPLFPYQEEGATFLACHERAGLFDAMGVGKSAQLIRALDLIGAKKVLVICPAAVREVWVGEFKKFALTHRRVLKGKDIQDLNLWLRGKVDVLLLSYEMATSWAKRMEGDLIDAIIFDEAHYLKNDQSIRTRAMLGHDCTGEYGLAKWGAYVWFATGTPNPNDAADIWSMMRFSKATPLNRKFFRDRYYTARTGSYGSQHTPRDTTLNELKQAIRSFSICRTKQMAGLQLPPIWLTTVTVDGDTTEIRQLLREYPDMEKAVLEAVEKGGLSFLDAQHVATLRRLVGEAKAPAYAALLAEELRDGKGKTVVGGIHVKALERIQASLAEHGFNFVLINGSTPETQRVKLIEAYKTSDEVHGLLGNLKAAGTGLTLIEGSDIDLFESAWAPADNAQFLMRVHRIGQKQAVTGRFITLANSIDVAVSDTVARKTGAIAKTGFDI